MPYIKSSPSGVFQISFSTLNVEMILQRQRGSEKMTRNFPPRLVLMVFSTIHGETKTPYCIIPENDSPAAKRSRNNGKKFPPRVLNCRKIHMVTCCTEILIFSKTNNTTFIVKESFLGLSCKTKISRCPINNRNMLKNESRIFTDLLTRSTLFSTRSEFLNN